MPRYKIVAHYNPGRAIVGYVTADTQRDALNAAEADGLLSQCDPDWDDLSAIVLPYKCDDLGSYRDQMIDAGRGHLLRGDE